MSESLPYADLPKWSRFVVSGDNVTEDQAAEIILRTSDLYFHTNDHHWRHQVHTLLGIASDKSLNNLSSPDSDKIDKVTEELGVLDLYYLHNSQIASCYIGGPHGWCSWNGHIGCDGYNIGKYPSVEEIYEEWKSIAATWPFLKLRCQIWNKGYGEESDSDEEDSHPRPVVEYVIENGTVTALVPKKKLRHSCSVSSIPAILMTNGERGCDLDDIKRAIKLAKEKH